MDPPKSSWVLPTCHPEPSKRSKIGRDGRIRTGDPLTPSRMEMFFTGAQRYAGEAESVEILIVSCGMLFHPSSIEFCEYRESVTPVLPRPIPIAVRIRGSILVGSSVRPSCQRVSWSV